MSKATNWTRYQKRGYMGLANLGNTCFMNTCLQVLNHVYELNHLFLERRLHAAPKTPKSDQAPETQLVNEWVELQEMMWGPASERPSSGRASAAISPNKFVHYVHHLAKVKGKEIFTGWAQNDMPEFLLFVMDCMHQSISRGVKLTMVGNRTTDKDKMALQCCEMIQTVYEKEYSEVLELFYGVYVSVIASAPTTPPEIKSTKPEMYYILDLPLPPAPPHPAPPHGPPGPPLDLYACLDMFTQEEVMEGDNAWYNEATQQKEKVTKRIQFWNFPPILVISLKRFTAAGHLKRQDLVTFPTENLDLSKYVCGYRPETYVYDLMGVCNHMGGVMGGHYTACVKNADQAWLHFNDTMVETVADPATLVRPTAYCLFYRRRPHLGEALPSPPP